MKTTKTVRTITLVFVLTVAAALFAVPAFAQETDAPDYAKTYTEQQINDSFRVNNPHRARVTDMSVDLQPGQAVITATYAFRNGETVTASSTYVPSISNGRVFWDVTSVVVESGETISDDLLNQINARVDTAWRNYFKGQVPGYVQDVTITENDITFVYGVDTFERPSNRRAQ